MTSSVSKQVLLIDDERDIRLSMGQSLELAGYQLETLERAEPALQILDRDWPGVVVCDISLPGMSGLELQQALAKLDSDLPVILITGHGDISMAVTAMRDGAYDFIEKPFSPEQLLDIVRRAIEKRSLCLENRQLKQELELQTALGPRMIGNTPAIVQLRQLVPSCQ